MFKTRSIRSQGLHMGACRVTLMLRKLVLRVAPVRSTMMASRATLAKIDAAPMQGSNMSPLTIARVEYNFW